MGFFKEESINYFGLTLQVELNRTVLLKDTFGLILLIQLCLMLKN